MKISKLIKFVFFAAFVFGAFSSALAQTETLTNAEIIKMSQAGLNKQIILEKISVSTAKFDLSTDELVNLKKEGVDDEVISAMFEVSRKTGKQNAGTLVEPNPNPPTKKDPDKTAAQLLREAKTIAFSKSSLYPALKDVESSLMKRERRARWERFNLTIVQSGFDADLIVQIGREFLTHYNFRVVDTKTGRIIAASGVTSLGGSLAGNVADKLIKRLDEVLANEPK
ncbi:MAG: hypothetical protein M3209_12665 [Acidobacteriota bacterium]|nr:hypothetical protein [Acidobacteriota bacterium]